MQTNHVLRSLGPMDLASVRRDPLLRWMLFMPVALALLLRWAVPALNHSLQSRFAFDLTPYYPVLMSYFVVLMLPFLFGMVIGFLLLDERDAGTLTALQVTPLTTTGYAFYRVALPTLLSAVMTLVAFPLAGLSQLGLSKVALAALSAALLAPAFALFVGSFAANKVQGFALTKGLGAVLLVPVAAFFVAPPWQYLFGLLPTYWPVKAYWLLEAGDARFWLYALVGVVYQAALLAVGLRRFNRVMHR